jgi:hypothetical protein
MGEEVEADTESLTGEAADAANRADEFDVMNCHVG